MDTATETPARAKNDPAWKEIIETFFPDFMHFCLPDLARQINWNIPWQTLDGELHALTKDADVGTRFVDKLFKVFLKNGQEQWILVHIEIQGAYYKFFAKRTFESIFRLHQHYGVPIASIAILTDEQENWRPSHYEVAFAGTRLCVEYSVIKLIDYRTKIDELERSLNPFASVILIQLAALAAKKDPDQKRLNSKFALTRRLYEKGFDKDQIIKFFNFIDWLIALPKALEVQYLNKVYELERGKNMAYVSTAEQFGREKGFEEGIQQGWQKGEAAVLIRQLTLKFRKISDNYRQKVLEADADTLLLWSERILDATTIEEIFI